MSEINLKAAYWQGPMNFIKDESTWPRATRWLCLTRTKPESTSSGCLLFLSKGTAVKRLCRSWCFVFAQTLVMSYKWSFRLPLWSHVGFTLLSDPHLKSVYNPVKVQCCIPSTQHYNIYVDLELKFLFIELPAVENKGCTSSPHS